MLIQFSVENFLSIKDNVVLSLLASKDNEHPEHLIVDGNKKHLKSAVIYGANASGKSNVLNAFWRSEERRVGKECRSRWSPYH